MTTDTIIEHIYVETRLQHSRGSASGFGGPDAYVALQYVPSGVTPLLYLRRDNTRGIRIRYMGEGYSEHTGPTSMLGIAIRRAHDIVRREDEERDKAFTFAVHHAE